MADFVKLWRDRGSVLDAVLSQRDEVNRSGPLREEMAIRIQRLYRGSRSRAYLTVMRSAVKLVQRVYRGHKGRDIRRSQSAAREEEIKQAVFHYYVTLVQKAFRGMYSRKYKHDFYRRKAYVDSIERKSEELRAQLAQQLEEQKERIADEAEEKARKEFKQVTKNLHHLVSTRNRRGIYNPVYAPDDPPAAFGIPLETHLRMAVKETLQTEGLHRGRDPPKSYAETRGTVAAASPYDIVKETTATEKRYERMKDLSRKPFNAGGTVKEDLPPRSVTQGVPYQERWRAARGTRELADTVELKTKRVSHEPFRTAVTTGRVFEEYERQRLKSRSGSRTKASLSGSYRK